MKNEIKYFAYARRSMDDVKRQVLSLPAQISQFEKQAKDNSLCLYETIDESMTAKEPGRPKFNRMLDRIEAGEANGILCWDIDRLYRNPIDEGRVRWLLQKGVIQSVRTPGREYTPRDAGLLMAVETGSKFWNEPPYFAQNGFIFRRQKIRVNPVVIGFREEVALCRLTVG